MADQDPSTKVANELLKHLKAGKQLMELITKELDEKYLVDGRTMKDWRETFNLKIPNETDPESLGRANAKLNNAINEAGFFHAHAIMVEQSIRNGAENKFDDAFRTLVETYRTNGKKLPANATLQKMAEGEDLGVKSAITTATARTKFWRAIVDTLHEKRRVVAEQRWIMWTQLKINQDIT